MPMYDRICENGHELLDCFERIDEATKEVPCKTCGALTKRAWLTKPSGVITDEIPGGVWIKHGICNEDGSPKKYYSKSEIAKAAKAKGLVNAVRHVSDPKSGSDKSPHTVRWV